MVIETEMLRQKVEDLASLPTLPGVVEFIAFLVEDTATSAQEIGDVISRDQVLSAKILRLVNSPVYGFPGRIASITHAVVLLGFNVVKGLVLTTTVFNTLDVDTQKLWQHSLGTAVISRRIAKELNILAPEEVMVAGLLHDLGKVILSVVMAPEYEEVWHLTQKSRIHISEAERKVFGIDHTRVASWIAEQWHLPTLLTEALVYHHKPARAKECPEVAAVVHVSDILSRGMGYGSGGDQVVPVLDHEAFHLLKLSYDQIDKVLADAELEYNRGVNIFTQGA